MAFNVICAQSRTVLFPTEVSSFDFQVEHSHRTVQYKLNAQSLRLFGLHSDVNGAHRAGATSSPKLKHTHTSSFPKQKNNTEQGHPLRGAWASAPEHTWHCDGYFLLFQWPSAPKNMALLGSPGREM